MVRGVSAKGTCQVEPKGISGSEFFGGPAVIFVFLRHFAVKQSSHRKYRNFEVWDKKLKSLPPKQKMFPSVTTGNF